ncbi:Undecaprenyl-phosphate mannosyltransferase [Pseudobythopirellula maris]|uniref:Undecaprenyl-phosphate mannosyltransferase n=1 Tax=Pseudobythopirellula maris TaxID=2527991 RepID=A0A5C5ZLW2_9BACT|nr:polyprenol monophosphomannose synthase [Pseudobythopirellula maris]TWT88444.1 Undecaprenyl-phosphate mannosyltransferase [Pseudobythopirellula maris]
MSNSRAEPRVLVVVATYNELENLPRLVDAIQQALPAADLLVVDDNSPDGTGAWCDERATSDPRVSCLHRAGKLGLGSATYDGFRHAIEHGYGIVVTTDADWSHPPERLPELVRLVDSGEADVAIGSRYCPGGKIEGWPLKRRVASRMVNSAARVMLRLPIGDCSGAFRAYRVGLLARLDFSAVLTGGYAYLEEILWRLKREGARFAEAPITFTDRVAGQSKINTGEAITALRVLATLGRREWLGPRR